MENYKIYFLVSHLLFISAFLLLLMLFITGDNGFIYFVGIIQILLGGMQLFTGIYFVGDKAIYPDYIIRPFKVYWRLTAIYFVTLVWLCNSFESFSNPVTLWLFLAPWPIAIYQFLIVRKAKEWKETSLNICNPKF